MSDPKGNDQGRLRRSGADSMNLPPVEALVGADAPCDPIAPPPEDRTWDSESGQWKRTGVEVPPDPAGMTYPPGTPSPANVRAFKMPRPQPADPEPEPMPVWAFAVVGVMFAVGIAIGLLVVAL